MVVCPLRTIQPRTIAPCAIPAFPSSKTADLRGSSPASVQSKAVKYFPTVQETNVIELNQKIDLLLNKLIEKTHCAIVGDHGHRTVSLVWVQLCINSVNFYLCCFMNEPLYFTRTHGRSG